MCFLILVKFHDKLETGFVVVKKSSQNSLKNDHYCDIK